MKDFIKNIKFSWKYAKDQKKKLIYFVIVNIIYVLISILVPILSAKMIVKLTSNMLEQVIYISLVLLFLQLLMNVINYLVNYFSQVIFRETFCKIQNSLGKEILKLENSCLDKNSSGMFIQRLTGDTVRTADVFNTLTFNLTSIVTNIGIFIVVFTINKIIFFYLVLMFIIIFSLEKRRVKIFNAKDKEFRQQNEKVSGFVGELVRGVRDIKMLNAEKSFMNELQNKVTNLNKKRYQMGKVNRDYSMAKEFIMDIMNTGIICLLIYFISRNILAVAEALVIHNYLGRVENLSYHLGSIMEKIKDFNLSTNRIFSILESKEFPKEKFGKKHLDKVNGEFDFNNVTFSYEKDEKVLNNLSFKVKANETVAFVGKSGAGKSTIFSLLCKMYDVNKGTITIDGIDIKELDCESIRNNITIISQNPYIFNLSIKDNLRLVKENLTEEEMIKACKMACLDDFINSLPEKYDTIVGEGGISLSGGQRQRLAIARAFVQKTEIILFDEATSALDNETQAKIQKAIENLQKDYTILIIAHRLSTIINSDRILYLDNGKIEAEGTHNELLKKNKEYKKLYEAEIEK